MAKKIFVLLGHPNSTSICSRLAEAYVSAAKDAGHEVRYSKLGEMHFDPILHMGYVEKQNLEPDLLKAQEDVKWAEHVVVVHPTWWGTMPALLKGFFDRTWLPGFAFNYNKTNSFWKRHLKGKSARLIVTSGSPVFILEWIFGARLNELKWLTFWFSGLSPVRTLRIGNMAKPTDISIAKAIARVSKLGAKGK